MKKRLLQGVLVALLAAMALPARAQVLSIPVSKLSPIVWLPLPITWKCVHADGHACTSAELANPSWYKQVFLTSAGFTEADRGAFWSEFDRMVAMMTTNAGNVWSVQEKDRLLFIGYFTPGGALGAPDAAFGALVAQHPVRGYATSLSQAAVYAKIASGGGQRDPRPAAVHRRRAVQHVPDAGDGERGAAVVREQGVRRGQVHARRPQRARLVHPDARAGARRAQLSRRVRRGRLRQPQHPLDRCRHAAGAVRLDLGRLHQRHLRPDRDVRLQHQRDPRRQRQRQHLARRLADDGLHARLGQRLLPVGGRHVLRPRHLPHDRRQPDERQPRAARAGRRRSTFSTRRRSSA